MLRRSIPGIVVCKPTARKVRSFSWLVCAGADGRCRSACSTGAAEKMQSPKWRRYRQAWHQTLGTLTDEARHVPLDCRGTPRTCHPVADEHGHTNRISPAPPARSHMRKGKTLLKEGVLEGKNAKHPNPRKRRTRAQPPQIRIMQPPPQGDDSLAMQSCSILELDQTRCHWPLGEVNAIATEFCGGATVPGHRYCTHHLRMARNSFL